MLIVSQLGANELMTREVLLAVRLWRETMKRLESLFFVHLTHFNWLSEKIEKRIELRTVHA